MALSRTCSALLCLAAGVLGSGCGKGGGGGEKPVPSTPAAQIRQAVDQANSTFAGGEYKRSCTFYTAAMQRKIVRMLDAPDCETAQERAAKLLRQGVSARQFRTLTTYGIVSADVHGATAIAHYGALPQVLHGIPGLKTRARLRMKRVRGRWLIASLPF
ncbi:MAG: hypothetical protein LC685_01160 [Actinobacteria bacterium]|nr:hypothetical protein [Actinomycetota bacterium]